MKVLRLRLKNLNSLVGEWEIDFTHPDYAGSGIFAITGPTGAGKTTILDAICLALYGQTPRLPRIGQNENELMSRQCGECLAEVEFETSQGRFRCHFGQHRARKLASGPLQAPRHEIVCADSGQVLESKRTAVAAKVEEVTGMDFGRFTRSMLLAQGGFAAFLQARADDRAPILEQITGTEIYSQLSVAVHLRTTEERAKLAELQEETAGLRFLTPEEEEALRRELEGKESEVPPLEARLVELRAIQAWLAAQAALSEELRQLAESERGLQAKQEAATAELCHLADAERALTLAPDYALLTAIRQQQQAGEGQRQALQGRLLLLEQGGQEAELSLSRSEAFLAQARLGQEREAVTIRQVRALDLMGLEVRRQLAALAEEVVSQGQQRDEAQASIERGLAQRGETEVSWRRACQFLADHQLDAGLTEAMSGLRQRLKALAALASQVADNQARRIRQQQAITRCQGQAQQVATALVAASQALTQAEADLLALAAASHELLQGRTLSAWRDESERRAKRHQRLLALAELQGRVAQTEARLQAGEVELSALVLEQQVMDGRERGAAEALARWQEVCRQRQDTVVLLNRVRDLEAERAQLIDGSPCPLCGASHHPYALGNVPSLDLAQGQLAEAEVERDQAAIERQRLIALRVGVEKDLEQRRQAIALGRASLVADQAAGSDEWLALALPETVEAKDAVVRQAAADEAIALAEARQRIAQGEAHELRERAAQAVVNQKKEAVAKEEMGRLATDLARQAAEAEGERLAAEAAHLAQGLAEALAEVSGLISPYGVEVSPERAEAVMASLSARQQAYRQAQEAEAALAKRVSEIDRQVEGQQARLLELDKTLAEKAGQQQELQAKVAQWQSERQTLYGQRDPDLEEKRLAAGLRQAEEGWRRAVQGHNRLQSELVEVRQQLVALADSLSERQRQLAEREPAFAGRLLAAGFADEGAFSRACLPPESLASLRQWANALRQEETELKARQRDRQQALAREQERALSERQAAEIDEEGIALAAQLNSLQQGLGALRQRLTSHRQQLERHQTQLAAIAKQGLEHARWQRLHNLIGSSDGKKFRNFAQGLTFELMVSHANQQLQKMTDRYLLVRDPLEPLELNVLDNYQAGEIRSTKNLSGGESFIVSLALSLGLSRMASRRVRVDSLFLDEGFGTLDEEALETALETLSGLQQDGKLIGIISHVTALKERIGTQIQVEAGGGGRSTLQGPGCRRLG